MDTISRSVPPEALANLRKDLVGEALTGEPKKTFVGELDANGNVIEPPPAPTPVMTQQEQDAVHNASCMRAADASMRAQHYMNYQAMRKLLPEPAMVSIVADTLTAAKAADQLARYDFGAMPLFLAKLKTLTFLEQVDLKRRVDNEIARWNDCKTALECIEDMRITDKGNHELMKINSMSHFGYNGTQEEFSKDYVEKMDQLKKIAAVLSACIDTNKEGLGTTSFTTREMIALMEKRVSELGIEAGSEAKIKYSQRIIDIFKNRTDFEFLRNRLEIYLKTNKKNLKKAFKEMGSNVMPKAVKSLCKIFGEDTMYRVWYTLVTYHINNDVDAIFVLFNFLAKLIDTEAKTGNAVWAKVFILNISDCQRNVFDIMDPQEYIEKIWEAFHIKIDKFLYDNKINSRIEPGYNYQFLMRTPEEYVNALPDYELNHTHRLLQEYADERQAAIDAAMAEMKKEDGLTPNDELVEDEESGVPTDPDSFTAAQMADVSARAEAAGIKMEEVMDAMTPEQKAQVVGRRTTKPIIFAADEFDPGMQALSSKVEAAVRDAEASEAERAQEDPAPAMQEIGMHEAPDGSMHATVIDNETGEVMDAQITPKPETPVPSMADRLSGMIITD